MEFYGFWKTLFRQFSGDTKAFATFASTLVSSLLCWTEFFFLIYFSTSCMKTSLARLEADPQVQSSLCDPAPWILWSPYHEAGNLFAIMCAASWMLCRSILSRLCTCPYGGVHARPMKKQCLKDSPAILSGCQGTNDIWCLVGLFPEHVRFLLSQFCFETRIRTMSFNLMVVASTCVNRDNPGWHAKVVARFGQNCGWASSQAAAKDPSLFETADY